MERRNPLVEKLRENSFIQGKCFLPREGGTQGVCQQAVVLKLVITNMRILRNI